MSRDNLIVPISEEEGEEESYILRSDQNNDEIEESFS